jgi:hypothetical protein
VDRPVAPPASPDSVIGFRPAEKSMGMFERAALITPARRVARAHDDVDHDHSGAGP